MNAIFSPAYGPQGDVSSMVNLGQGQGRLRIMASKLCLCLLCM
jgi:hypothetical protein